MGEIKSTCYDCNKSTLASMEALPTNCPHCGSQRMSSTGRMFMVHDIIENNGKSIRENNLEKRHRIPVGALVEVKYDRWHGHGACEKVQARLWVVEHSRDCDGTPLYVLSRYRNQGSRDPKIPGLFAAWTESGFGEESLTVVEVTKTIEEGYGALEWDDE